LENVIENQAKDDFKKLNGIHLDQASATQGWI